MNGESVDIHDRFYEPELAMNEAERQRENGGWAVFKDRATGKALVVCANDRAGALWVLRALNAADKTADRLSEDAA